MKNTKKSLVVSIIALLLCSCMFIGSTFAWFTDTVSNTGNKIQAGTLDIGLEQFKKTTEKPNGDWFDISGSGKPVFNYDKWEPGYSDVALLKVTNKGNLALKYVLNIKQGIDPTTGEQSALEVNEKGHTLADAIWVYSKVGATTIPTAIPADSDIDNTDALKWHKTLLKDALAETDSAVHGVLLANIATTEAPSENSYATMVVILHMDENAGNEYQGLSLGTSFDIELRATQYTYEEDGFGSDQYDALADGTPDHPEFNQSSVQPTIKKLVVPTDPEQPRIVRAAEEGESLTVSEGDMSVTYTPGTKLTEETKQAEDKKTADAKIGFVFESEEDQFNLELEADQQVAQYELTLNLDENNNYLNKVVKHIGAGLSNVKVYHANKEGLLTKLSSNTNPSKLDKTQGAVESYYYNETSGDLTLWVFHASPVEIVYDTPLDGSGTEEDPYIIETAKDFTTMVKSGNNYKLANDIELTGSDIVQDKYYGFDSVISYLNNVVIDGDNHKIKYLDDDGVIIGDFLNSTLKNVKFESNSPICGYADKSDFESIDIKGSMIFGGNGGIMAIYCYSLNFSSCVIDVDVIGSFYNGVFMGYNFGGTFNINNCEYKGEYISEQSGIVFGNGVYTPATIYIDNFVNNGTIRHTKVDGNSAHQILGINHDGQMQSKTVIIDGIDINHNDENLVFAGTGSYIVGPKDEGMQLSLNDDKTFTFTKSSNNNVSYYEVEIFSNVKHVGLGGGSGNISVIETINSAGSETYTTKLKKLRFADGQVASYKILDKDVITIENVDYYMNSNTNYVISSPGCYNAQLVIRAYDSNNKLVSSNTIGY